MFAIIAIYALLASTFVLAKLALGYADPFFLIGVRMSLAGLCMGFFALLSQPKKEGSSRFQALFIAREDRWTFVKIAFFHIYLAFTCEFWALQSLSSAKTNLIYTATPFIAACLSYFILNERLSWKKIAGLTLGLIGLLPVSLSSEDPHSKSWLGELLPEAILMVAVISASYAWFDIKKMMSKGYSLIWINGFSMFLGGVASLITTALFCPKEAFHIAEPLLFFKYVAAMILVSNFIFYNGYGWLMRRYSITFLTFAGFLSPIFGAIYGKLLLDEPIHWGYGCSLATITLALYIFYKEELKKGLPSLEHPPESS